MASSRAAYQGHTFVMSAGNGGQYGMQVEVRLTRTQLFVILSVRVLTIFLPGYFLGLAILWRRRHQRWSRQR